MRIAIGAGLALAALPACAQTYYADGPNGSTAGKALQIQVTATVGGHCGFTSAAQAPSGSFNQPNFDSTGFTHDFSFQLDCTGPSRVAVVSSNGGLLTPGAVPSGYATLAPYDVLLNLNGASATASASCTAASLKTSAATACTFRGTASTTTGLLLSSNSVAQTGTYLRVSAPAYTGSGTLVAGTYTDTLVVTVSAAS